MNHRDVMSPEYKPTRIVGAKPDPSPPHYCSCGRRISSNKRWCLACREGGAAAREVAALMEHARAECLKRGEVPTDQELREIVMEAAARAAVRPLAERIARQVDMDFERAKVDTGITAIHA